MFKKFIAFFAIIIMSLSLVSIAYAEAGYKTAAKEINVFQLVNNNVESKTFEAQLVLSGRSNEGTVITLNHWWYKVGEDESILKKDTNKDAGEEGEWVLANEPEEWTIGASGILAITVELKEGQNKIVLAGKDSAGNIKTETIKTELVDKNKVKEYFNNLILKDININQK